MKSYFTAIHGGFCDRCDASISVGDLIVRNAAHELLCRRCGKWLTALAA